MFEKCSKQMWCVHFFLCISVMLWGMWHNGGRKLVSAGPQLDMQEECRKTYINALATSLEEPGSTICCNDESVMTSLLCTKQLPPGERRLTRFPDALLIPLIPILLRGLYFLLFGDPEEKWSGYVWRFGFYILLIAYRTFGLYVLADRIEDALVTPIQECWYLSYARRPSCHGREFDFSDHTVLFYGQILPIVLTEVLHSWYAVMIDGSKESIGSSSSSSSSSKTRRRIVSWILSLGAAYLYVITLLEEFRTASYFHTRWETWVGFLLSLSIPLPLAFLQCWPTWGKARNLLFGYPSSQSHKD